MLEPMNAPRRLAKLLPAFIVAGLGASIAPATASACPSSPREAVRCEVNAVRSAHGLKPLAASAHLRRSAQAHANDMVTRHFFSHVAPGGGNVKGRVRSAGYLKGASSFNVGENIAWGSGPLGTPKATVAAWMNSPGHRAIILTPGFREAGIGVVSATPTGSAGATWVLNVGRRTR
jgi:uncharacterized protein YkwD